MEKFTLGDTRKIRVKKGTYLVDKDKEVIVKILKQYNIGLFEGLLVKKLVKDDNYVVGQISQWNDTHDWSIATAYMSPLYKKLTGE